MRTFEKTGAQRAQSQDGVAIYSVDQFTKRYERPDKYCDLDRSLNRDRDGGYYAAIDLQGALRTGREGPLRQGIFWTLPDGSKQPVTDTEKLEMVHDFEAAYRALGERAVFD